MSDRKALEGKVALITGGAKRLGRGAALTLAEAGADVAITYLRSAKEAQRTIKDLEKTGVRALAVRCDVKDPKSVRTAIREVIAKLGQLDVLINNAGVYETVTFDDLTVEQWDSYSPPMCAAHFWFLRKLCHICVRPRDES
jgi:3-oxoacyl-[acyl-carrier protein] reductase/pteridine reductase